MGVLKLIFCLVWPYVLCVVKWLDGWKEVPSWQNAKTNEMLTDSTATFIKTAASRTT